ncbi:MAG: hypothetical protein GY938_30155 [Ketobacter sp.]|nr:hypothetical protein [Ketobacter sp.]
MGINPLDFRQYVVRPTLKKLGAWTPSLENLLLGSAAQASQLGMELQCDAGLGVYKIKRELHHRVWDEFLAFDADLASKVRGFASQREFLANPDMELAINLAYSTAIAWGVYALNKAEIPEDENNPEALAWCWYHYFRTDEHLKPEHFLAGYKVLSAPATKNKSATKARIIAA